jgi:hypothetical protein
MSVFFIFLALGINIEAFSIFLNPAVTSEQLPLAVKGALTLKVLLVIDALLTAAIALLIYRGSLLHTSTDFEPQWLPPSQANPADWLSQYSGVMMGLVLLIATGLRLISLNSDLWMDEVFTLVGTVRLEFGQILSLYVSDNQHTHNSLLAKLSTKLLGESAFALRLPAVIFGVASIWAAARLALLVFGLKTSLFTAAVLTLSYHHIWFSQNARGYTLLLFSALLATDLLLRGLKTGYWRYWLMYALVIGIGAWAHLTGVLIGLAHGLVILMLLMRDRSLANGRWKPLVALALSAWITLHFYALVIPQILEFFTQTKLIPVAKEWTSPGWLISEIFNRLGLGALLGWIGLVIVMPVAAYAFYWFMRRDWLFVALSVAPGLLIISLMLALGRNLWPRMLFHEIGFAVILLVVGYLAIGNYVVKSVPRLSNQLAIVPLVLLLGVFGTTLPGLYKYPKQDYTGARDFIKINQRTNDRVVGVHMAGKVYRLYYAPEWPGVSNTEELEAHKSRSGHTWVLYTLSNYLENRKPELWHVLQTDYELVKYFPGTLGDGDIFVLRSRQPASPAK